MLVMIKDASGNTVAGYNCGELVVTLIQEKKLERSAIKEQKRRVLENEVALGLNISPYDPKGMQRIIKSY